MRIHSDTLTVDQITVAARYATQTSGALVYVDSLSMHGSRKRQHAHEVKLHQ